MNILIACEFSGTVRDAFIEKGHNAVSCDLLPSDSNFGDHYQGSVFDIINEGWDMMIAHPPCTYLTNAGVTWLYNKDKTKNELRWEEMGQGAEFFKRLLNAKIPRICVENPIMHKYAKDIIGVNQSQIVQPWMFGHPESKATCLWLKGLPLLQETNNVKKQFLALPKREAQRLHYLPPSADRWKIRSKTYDGVAAAMASQWGTK